MHGWNILALATQSLIQANLSEDQSLQEDRRDHGICRKFKGRQKSRRRGEIPAGILNLFFSV